MSNGGINSSSQALIPMFKGENYHLWNLKMTTLFKSQELWDLVEKSYSEPNPAPAIPDQQLRENRKKDAKALLYIQSAMDDTVSPRISAASTSKQAWEILKKEYFGDKKVIAVKLQTLHSSFENMAMQDKETVQSFLSRVSDIVSQMRIYGDTITNETIVSKVLRCLHKMKDYKHVVTAILESKDLSTYTFDELMSSLMAHEERMDKSTDEDVKEKAFQVKGKMSKGRYYDGGRGRGSSGRGRGQGCEESGGRGSGQGRSSMSSVQCYYCKRYGHKEDRC